MHKNLRSKQFTVNGSHGRKMAVDVTYPSSGGVLDLVVYAHGINGFKDWGGMQLVANAFAELGFAFLKFNFSHNGTTTESLIDFVDLEAYKNDNYKIRQYDLNLLFDELLKPDFFDFYVQKVNLIGHSRGGVDAILFASHDRRVNKLMTWAAPCNVQTQWSRWDEEKLMEWKGVGVVKILNGRTKQEMPIGYQLVEEYEKGEERLNLKLAARSLTIPWLIVHGTNDEAVPLEQATVLKGWQPRAVFVPIEGAGHTFDRVHPWTKDVLPMATLQLISNTASFLI